MQQQQREGRVTAVAFLKLEDTAVIPSRADSCSVGYDLTLKNNGVKETVPAHGKRKIRLGLRAFIQDGCYGRIAPCSSMSWYYHTSVSAGVIHPGYKKELFVLLFNHSEADLEIMPGQKIAQLILERCETPPVLEARADPQAVGGFSYDVITGSQARDTRKEEDGEINDDDEEDFSRRTVDDDRAEAAAAEDRSRRRRFRRSRQSNRRYNNYHRRSEKYSHFKRRW